MRRRLFIFFGYFADADGAFALEESDTLIFAGGDNEEVFIGEREIFLLESFACGFEAFRGVGFQSGKVIGRGELAHLIGSDFDDFRIGRDGRFAEVAQNHIAVTLGDFLPGAEHDVVEGLLEIELRDRGDGGAETAFADGFAHGVNEEGIFIHEVVIPEHLGIGRESAAGHREEGNDRFDFGRFGRDEVIPHGFFEHFGELENFIDIDVQSVVGAAQSVPHRDDVGLAGAAGDGREAQINLAHARFDGGHVGDSAGAGGFMGVEDDVSLFAQEFAGHFDGSWTMWAGGSGGVFEDDAVIGDAGIKDAAERFFVEGDIVCASATGRQLHHGDGDFMFQACVVDTLPAPDEVIDVVEGIEIADNGDPMFFEHFGMEVDDVFGLSLQGDDADTAGQGLQFGIGPGCFAVVIHDIESIFAGIEDGGLEQGAAAGFQMFDTAFLGGVLNQGQVVLGKYSCSEDGLESIPEGSQHKVNFFHGLKCFAFNFVQAWRHQSLVAGMICKARGWRGAGNKLYSISQVWK